MRGCPPTRGWTRAVNAAAPRPGAEGDIDAVKPVHVQRRRLAPPSGASLRPSGAFSDGPAEGRMGDPVGGPRASSSGRSPTNVGAPRTSFAAVPCRRVSQTPNFSSVSTRTRHRPTTSPLQTCATPIWQMAGRLSLAASTPMAFERQGAAHLGIDPNGLGGGAVRNEPVRAYCRREGIGHRQRLSPPSSSRPRLIMASTRSGPSSRPARRSRARRAGSCRMPSA